MKFQIIIFSSLISIGVFGQDILSLDQAISNTLANNLNIKIAQNQVEMADNSATRGNAGGLPTVTAGAGANGSLTNTNLVFAGNAQPPLERTGAQSATVSGNVTANYVLFNGFTATNTFTKLELQSELMRTQSQMQIEAILLQTINAYFLTLQLQSNLKAAEKSLETSIRRHQREALRVEFGSSNNIALLNADVDMKNDSIIVMNIIQQLENAKNNLSYLMGVEGTIYELNDDISLSAIGPKNEVVANAFEQNLSLIQARHNLEISEKDMDISKGSYYPSLNISTGYSFSNNQSDASFIQENRSNGLNGGISLNYNLFNGGRSAIARENASINWEINDLKLADAKKLLETKIDNAFATYENNVAMLKLRTSAFEVNKLNFSRSEELFKNGQITGTEFREAQLNLLNAEVQQYLSLVSAKVSEYELLRLSGVLVN